MGTMVSSIRKGDKFWCTHRQLGVPMLGTVICLTHQPGKLVGLQFDEPVPELVAHLDCDKRGKKGYCIWAHPGFLFTEEEFKNRVPEFRKKSVTSPDTYLDLDELALD